MLLGHSTERVAPSRGPLGLRVVAAAVGVAFAFPAIYLIWRNFTSSTDPLGILFSDRTVGPLRRSLILAAVVSVAAGVLGTWLAFVTTRTNVAGHRVLRVLLPLPLVYPTFVGAAAFIRTLSPGGIASDMLETIGIGQRFELRGLFGASLVLTLFTYPYVYLPVAARLRRLSGSLEESARLLGDTGSQAFRRVVLPQIAGSISTGTLLVFLYAISDFGAVQLMRYDTLTRAIWTTRLNNQRVSLALSLILLVVAAAAVSAERLVSRRFVVPARVRGSKPLMLGLGRGRVPTAVGAWFVVFLGLIAPAVALGDWAITGMVRSARGERSLFIEASDIVEPTVNTAVSSAVTAFLAVLAVLPIAFLVGRYRSRVGEASNAVVLSTFAMPGLLIALAIFFWTGEIAWAKEHVRGTFALLVFAYVVRFGAQAIGSAQVATSNVPERLGDAAQMLGAGRVRRFFTVDLPIMLPGLLAGGGLVLLATMKELPITLFIAPFDFPTLTTKTFLNFEDAFVAEAGIFALVLVALSAVLTWLLVIRKADHLS